MLELDLQVRRPHSYFNDKDLFVCNNGLCGLLVTKLEFDRGSWWALSGLKFKADSVAIMNTNELLGKEVKLKGYEYYGKIANFLSPIVGSKLVDLNGTGHSKAIIQGSVRSNFGVTQWAWRGDDKPKKLGLPSFWTETNDLELKF